MTDGDRLSRPGCDVGVLDQHEQHHRAIELRAQGGDVDRPGPELVFVDAQLNLDHHTGHCGVLAIAQHDDAVGAILGRGHLRQVDRPLLGAMVIEGKGDTRSEQLRRELAARAKQVDEYLMGERRHGERCIQQAPRHVQARVNTTAPCAECPAAGQYGQSSSGRLFPGPWRRLRLDGRTRGWDRPRRARSRAWLRGRPRRRPRPRAARRLRPRSMRASRRCARAPWRGPPSADSRPAAT